jgi:hypothetical protein
LPAFAPARIGCNTTREIQRALDRYSSTAARAGRLREYVESGDISLLPLQSAAVVEVRNTVSLIQRLTSDNVSQQASFKKLLDLTERRIALFAADRRGRQ